MVSLRQRLGWLGALFVYALPVVCALPVRAEVVPDLYAVSLPVAEQSQSELQRAAAVGLRELAVRISGRSAAAGNTALAPVLGNATRLVDQYRYERSAGADAPWVAHLHFAPASVDSELRRAGLPIWGTNRPALKALVALDDNGSRSVVDESSPFVPLLREQWRRRGLLLHLPRDASAVNSDAVWRLDSATITANAGQRFDGLLLARVALTQSGCDGKAQLMLGAVPDVNALDGAGAPFAVATTGDALSACIAGLLDRIVDNVSPQYAIAANSSAEGLTLRVVGVASFEDYAALLSYLRRLAAVKSAQPISAQGDEVLIQLNVASTPEQMARQLALESRLAPTETSAMSPATAVLNYRWTGVANRAPH